MNNEERIDKIIEGLLRIRAECLDLKTGLEQIKNYKKGGNDNGNTSD